MLRSMEDFEGYAIAATAGVLGQVRNLHFDDEAWIIRYFVVDTGGWLSNRKVLSHQESNMLLRLKICQRRCRSAFAGSLLAAPSAQLVAAASDASASSTAGTDMKPDHACMDDLRTFCEQMQMRIFR